MDIINAARAGGMFVRYPDAQRTQRRCFPGR
jgi:hypothetical protein